MIFVFPGQGAQRVGMGRELYRSQEVFREEVDRCGEVLKRLIGVEGKELWEGDEKEMEETEKVQPGLFVFEYGLAKQWMSWGVKPAGMIGHSLGEWVAACIAGVMDLEEGLRLVVERGRRMQEMRRGAMVAIEAGAEEVEGVIGGGGGEVSIIHTLI